MVKIESRLQTILCLNLVHSKLVVSVWPDLLSQIPAYQEECVGSESYSGT